jgi:hypothetical protein
MAKPADPSLAAERADALGVFGRSRMAIARARRCAGAWVARLSTAAAAVCVSCAADESSSDPAKPVDQQQCLCNEAIRVCGACCPKEGGAPYELCVNRIRDLLEAGSLAPSQCGDVLENCEELCPVPSDPCGR